MQTMWPANLAAVIRSTEWTLEVAKRVTSALFVGAFAVANLTSAREVKLKRKVNTIEDQSLDRCVRVDANGKTANLRLYLDAEQTSVDVVRWLELDSTARDPVVYDSCLRLNIEGLRCIFSCR